MKVFTKTPQNEMRVRRGKEENVYELWHLVPTCLGTAEKLGNQRYRTDDGMQFPNLEMAARHLAARVGTNYAKEVEKRPATRRKVTGMDIVGVGSWVTFCKMKKIDPKDMAALKKHYVLSNAELTKLGLMPE